MSNNPYYLLQGVRVVELTTYVAAPSAGRILADWGAECIKVEAPPRGDTTRFAVPLPGMRPLAYDIHNANKKSIALNLKTPEGQVSASGARAALRLRRDRPHGQRRRL